MREELTGNKLRVKHDNSLTLHLTVGKEYDIYYDSDEGGYAIKDDRGTYRFDIMNIVRGFEFVEEK